MCHEGCSDPPHREHISPWCWNRMHQGHHRGCWGCHHCRLRELDAVPELGTWKGNVGFAPWAVLPAQDQGWSSTWSSPALLDAVGVGRSNFSPARFASLPTKAGGAPAFTARRIGTSRNYTTDIQAHLKVLFQPLLGLRRSLIKAASFPFTIM